MQAFKRQLDVADQWHNSAPFPANESDEHAYKACHDLASAKIHCPQRWAAMEKWCEYIETVMSMIYPKIQSMFYFTGPKATAANCPIQMLPHYNPSNGAMFFRPSRGNCTTPSYFGLPFFLKRYGPKFQEWSVTGHESRPGHHTQMQGSFQVLIFFVGDINFVKPWRIDNFRYCNSGLCGGISVKRNYPIWFEKTPRSSLSSSSPTENLKSCIVLSGVDLQDWLNIFGISVAVFRGGLIRKPRT